MPYTIRLRRDTASNWGSTVLADGEVGYDTTNNQFRVGNGSSTWGALSPIGGGNTFGTIAVAGQSNVVADQSNDTLTLVAGSNITLTTTAGTDTITIAASSSGVTDGNKGDITVSGTGATWTINNGVITYAKIQDVSTTDRLLGRSSAGSGVIEEITCTSAGRALLDDIDAAAQRTTLGLGTLATQSGTFSGTSSGTNTGDQTITLTGDVTGSGTGSFAATIANDAVTYSKIQNVSATDKILGRQSAGAGDIEEITCTAAGRALLDDANASAQRTTLGVVAGGAGDIWVEKAGDSATATNTLTSGFGTGWSWTYTASPASTSTTQNTAFDFSNTNNAGLGVDTGNFFALSGIGMYPGANNTGNVSTVRGAQLFGQVATSTSNTTLGTTTNSIGALVTGATRFSGTSTGTITNCTGLSILPVGNAAYTVANSTGVSVQDCGTGNTITTQIGIDVAAQTRGSTTNVGMRIGTPSGATTNAALQLSGTGGTAASGILFGTDTNLYRSAANTLRTDDTFSAANVSGTNTGDQTITLTGDVTGSGTGSFATTLATVPISKGGTGQTTATAAFDALAPTITAGDIIYYNGTDNVRLGIGTAGQVLKVNSVATAPEWGTDNTGGGGGSPGGANTEIQFNESGSFGGDPELTWNTSTKLLTVDGNIQLSDQGNLRFADADSSNYVAFQAPATITSNVTWTLPSTDGSADQVLKTNGSGTLGWVTAGSGSGTKTYAVFTPLDNYPPASNFATLDTRNTTSPILVLDFDAGTDESAIFHSIMPEAASLGSGLKIQINWMATTATSGTCRWSAEIERMNTDEDTDDWGTPAGTAGTVTNATSGIITTTVITITAIDSVAAGEPYRLRITRDADGTSGTDDMSGDAELVSVEVRSAS